MAVGDYLTWAVQAQDAPAHVARILQTILLNEGIVDKAGNSFQVTEDTGANMQISVGSGTLGDLAVVEGDDVAGQGVYVIEAQNATVTRTIAASDPSDDRIDLVVLQNYDDEADSSGNNDAEVEVIQGTPAGSPSAPALPDSAIPLAEVLVGAGVTAITDANITDTRANAKTGGAAPAGIIGEGTDTGSDAISAATGDRIAFSATPPVGRRLRLWAEYSYNADATAGGSLQLTLRVDSVTVREGVGPQTRSTSSTEYMAVTVWELVDSTGSQMDFAVQLENRGSAPALRGDVYPGRLVLEDLGPA